MRIGGLASGIDTDNIIKELMAAERMPLDKMEQNKIKYEWQRDAFRDINKKIAEFDKLILDMKMSSTYQTKKASSTQENLITATGSSSALDGTYSIDVTKLASSEMHVLQFEEDEKSSDPIKNQYVGDYKITTFGKNGEDIDFKFSIKEGESYNDVFKKINNKDSNVRISFDNENNKIILESTRTGVYSTTGSNEIVISKVDENGNEIVSENSNLFIHSLGMNMPAKPASDAEFSYNGLTGLKSKTNSYTIHGVTFEFKGETNGPAILNVTSDTAAAVGKITEFVEKYNELVEALNGTQQETKYRDFPPLTAEQRKEMSESEIELWEEKAKSGLLKGESIISTALFDIRSGWYKKVDNDGAFSYLSEIGITTTRDYLDGGKLEINETKLKEALEKDPASVQKLFSDSSTDGKRGLLNRLEDALDKTVSKIEERAGKGTSTLDNYTLGKRVKSLDEQIAAFEDRLKQIEDRYWRQFTAMERAISMMNNQSSMLMSFSNPAGY